MAKEGRKRPTVTVEDIQLPYIEINMTDGTLCDLSNTKRLTRVFYVCNEDAKHELYSIKETSTCEYEAIVLSPLLCLSQEFKVTAAPENQINCYSVGKSPSKPKGLKALEDEAKKQQLEILKNKKDMPPFPGGIFGEYNILNFIVSYMKNFFSGSSLPLVHRFLLIQRVFFIYSRYTYDKRCHIFT